MLAPYTMNHYGYCWNRPLDLLDLNGMWPSLSDIGNGIKNAASTAGAWCADHKEEIAKVAITSIAVVAAVGITVATCGTAAGVIVAASAGVGALYGGVTSTQSGGNIVDGVTQGALCGTVMGVSAVVNPVGAFSGGLTQVVTDIMFDSDSSMETYAGAFVGGAAGAYVDNAFIGGMVATATGEILEKVDGVNNRSIGKIMWDTVATGAISGGVHWVAGKIPWIVWYYLHSAVMPEIPELYEIVSSGAFIGLHNYVAECID
jgi:hypothetical protein